MKQENLELSSLQKEALKRRLQKNHSNFGHIALPDMPNVPGMISEFEKKYLYWIK